MAVEPDTLVRVMLSREDVEALAEDGFQAQYTEARVEQACRRALVPGLPDQIVPKLLAHGSADFEEAAEWISHVYKHGYEAE